MTRQLYDNTRLNELVKEGLILLKKHEDNEHFTRDTVIEYKCSNSNCNIECTKRFGPLYKNKNFGCGKCSNKIKVQRAREKAIESGRYKQVYDVCFLKKFSEENNLKLSRPYNEDEFITRDTDIEFRCCLCEEVCTKNFRALVEHKNFGCDKCSIKITLERVQDTNIQNRGVRWSQQDHTVRERGVITNMQKFGVPCSLSSKEVREKGNLTKERVHGDRNYNNREQYKETSMDRFGVPNPSQAESVKQKKTETSFANYGVEHPLQSPIIMEKIIQTNINTRGVRNISQDEAVKQKKIQTSLANHGVKHPMQNPNILHKAFISSHRIKDYTFPSGKILKYQGYENFAIDDLIKDSINVDDIETTKVPEVMYYDLDNKEHRYFVDIFIPSLNKCIEVKSEYTVKCDFDTIKLKQQAVKGLGYKCEIWVYNKKGERVECII